MALFKYRIDRTCNNPYPHNSDLRLAEDTYCDRREDHVGAHEGTAIYVNGKQEKVYW